MAIEGVIFADVFIANKEQFIEIFEQYYKENEEELNKTVQPLYVLLNDDLKNNTNVTKAISNKFKGLWKEFEKKVLLNDRDLELLVIYRGEHGSAKEISKILPQHKVQNGGIDTSNKLLKLGNQITSNLEARAKAQQVEAILQDHINSYLKHLNGIIDIRTAESIHDYHESDLIEKYQNSDVEHISLLHWYQAFFSGSEYINGQGESVNTYYSGQGLGQAYDAFFQHLADKEKDIFNYLKTRGKTNIQLSNSLFSLNRRTVFEEENGVGPDGNFTKMLKRGRNHIAWFTGGDIVIVDPKTMSTVYNIQLKTTGTHVQGTFDIAIRDLRTFISNFCDAKTYRQKAEYIFQYFHTEISNESDFNSLPKETAEEIVIETLSKNLKLGFLK